MNYDTAVHEAGHLLVARSLGHEATLLPGNEELEAIVRVSGNIGFDDALVIRMSGAAAEYEYHNEWSTALINSEFDYRIFDQIQATPEVMNIYEDRARIAVFDLWVPICELAEQLVLAHE
ncbi:hypothetical protein [Nocardioides soli]|uniref:Peptidase M41 domain-containing protein n=1 Tax=Nocardioides soli TaxID=1036020 RepID=A0A7W4Z3C2_9ACTN|nr:hypothetical protein [Nocardioides soli]MBB3044807.1 hypothetical protein [Nocardioides soli]